MQLYTDNSPVVNQKINETKTLSGSHESREKFSVCLFLINESKIQLLFIIHITKFFSVVTYLIMLCIVYSKKFEKRKKTERKIPGIIKI